MDFLKELLHIERPNTEKFKINSGDQVFAIHESGYLLYGTVNNQIKKLPKKGSCSGSGWSVRWVNDLDIKLEIGDFTDVRFVNQVSESQLEPTDRLMYKGCKVRSLPNDQGEIMHGACQSVIYHLDLRVVGTSTVIRRANIEQFTHLKDYKQKSVVHFQGWLGVIIKVERDVEIFDPECPENSRWCSLDSVIKLSPFGNEPPLIFKSILDASKEYIKNLKVTSVTVKWHHQIDWNYPDTPRTVFTNESFRKLQIVMENVSKDDTQFFELGSLGRYRVNDNSDFCTLKGWQQKIVKIYAPSMINKIISDKPNRMVKTSDELAVQSEISNKSESELVVELIHVYSTPYIQWQNGTIDMTSSLDLEIVDEIFLDSTNYLVPGHFIYSSQLGYKSNDAYFVLLNEKETINGRKYVVRVLDTHIPGKVLKSEAFIDVNPVLELHKAKPHPIYQYFNGIYTIVVIQNVDNLESVRIGHVIGTNLDGKINVRCVDNGRNEWFWPANCAIYTVRKFDLDCVKSNITDNENEADPEIKLRNIIESLKRKVELVWKNDSQSQSDLEASLFDFEILCSSYQGLLQSRQVDVEFTAYTGLKDYIQKEIEIGCLRYKNNVRLTALVLAAVREMLRHGESVLVELTSKIIIDEPVEEHDPVSSHFEEQDDIQKMFSKTVDVLETHPPGHKYANHSYEPQHRNSFLKTVKEELAKLDQMCPTVESKIEMGILTRCYGDRMDLFSVLMKGALGTPYADSLYLFDAYLSSNYPNEPPKFHFHSFNAGRLNPNLYEQGKVCVSLLGTWEGREQSEKWTKDSDIEQILVSIKALILVKDPYHNEPGQEANKYSKADAMIHNRKYNQNLMPQIIKMIINQITFGFEPWQEEIKIFYKHQIPIFIDRWSKWLNVSSDSLLDPNEKPGFEIYPMQSAFVNGMRTSLTELQNIWNTKLNF